MSADDRSQSDTPRSPAEIAEDTAREDALFQMVRQSIRAGNGIPMLVPVRASFHQLAKDKGMSDQAAEDWATLKMEEIRRTIQEELDAPDGGDPPSVA